MPVPVPMPVPRPQDSGVRVCLERVAWGFATIDVVLANPAHDRRSEDYVDDDDPTWARPRLAKTSAFGRPPAPSGGEDDDDAVATLRFPTPMRR